MYVVSIHTNPAIANSIAGIVNVSGHNSTNSFILLVFGVSSVVCFLVTNIGKIHFNARTPIKMYSIIELSMI